MFLYPIFFVSLFLLLSIHLHLIDLFIDAPHTPCHKTCLFVTTEPDRQEGGQTYMSHKTQHVNPTVISDPKGNRPLGVYSINLTHTMLWYTTKMLQYTNLKMFRITLHRKKFRSLNPRVNRQRQSLCFFFYFMLNFIHEGEEALINPPNAGCKFISIAPWINTMIGG